MYSLIMLSLIGVGLWITISGARRRRISLAIAGIMVGAGTALFFWLMGFWGEMLWFKSLGYSERIWEVLFVRLLAGGASALVSAGFVLLFTLGYSPQKRLIRYAAAGLAAAVGTRWGIGQWENILRFIYAAPTNLSEPVFGHTVGFYLFYLPLSEQVLNLLYMLTLLTVAACVWDAFILLRLQDEFAVEVEAVEDRIGSVYRAAGLLLIVMALDKVLDRFLLMYSELGAVTGPGWTDVNVRLPALTVMIVMMILVALVLVVSPLRRRVVAIFQNRVRNERLLHGYVIGGVAITVLAVQLLALNVTPALFQSLRVEPNEITFERPYIANNIRFTRSGFKLDVVEEREYPASETFSAETVTNNPTIFSNIRLWDWRALDAVYKQFQEIRLYYEFDDVDVDRYTIDGDYRQVMVSAREVELENLPEQSQTFVNRRFKYTHGYGITMTNVSQFTPQGLPDLLIRDIPPKYRSPDIAVERPELYYGELTRTPVVVNSREPEFDYPQGDANATIQYPGQGGVALENIWRKVLYGWKFDGLRLLLSGYPTAQSRIMFHRQIEERVRVLAPFLSLTMIPTCAERRAALLDRGCLYHILPLSL